MENWRSIQGYEGLYEVSDLGRVRSLSRMVACRFGKTRVSSGRVRAEQRTSRGRVIVTLCKDNVVTSKSVHRLVAQAFLPGFTQEHELNHIDGDPSNNRLCNLEITTPSLNQLHAVRTGLRPKIGTSKYRYVCYVKNPRAKNRWASSVKIDGRSQGWRTFATEIEAARHADAYLDVIGDVHRPRNFPKPSETPND